MVECRSNICRPGVPIRPFFLLCSVLLPTCSSFAIERKIELPRSQVDVRLPAVTGRTITVQAGHNLNAAVNAALPGDQIVLQAGAVFFGPLVLPNKQGAGWITIRSSGALPAEGVRIRDTDTNSMATLVAPGNNAPALQTDEGAHGYRIIGLNITAAPNVTRMSTLVNLGEGSALQNTLASQPHDIVIDRSAIHGSDTLDLRRGVALNCANCAIINSIIDDVHSVDSDSQAIAGWNGTGPFLIENNDLQASGENVMFGGADPNIPNALPRDITIRRNDIRKPLRWKGVWQVKNLLELKLGQRVLVELNTFAHTWADAQTGFALNLKSTDQEGRAPWSNTSNVTVRENTFRNVVSGISLAASPEPNRAVPMSDIAITNNVFENVGGPPGKPSGTLFFIAGYGGQLHNIVIENNVDAIGSDDLNTTLEFDGEPTTGLVVTHNTLTEGLYGVKGSGSGAGAATLQMFAPGIVFKDNKLIGADPERYGNYAADNVFRPASPNKP